MDVKTARLLSSRFVGPSPQARGRSIVIISPDATLDVEAALRAAASVGDDVVMLCVGHAPTRAQQAIVESALTAAAELGVGCECRLFASDADRIEAPVGAGLA